jgi:hypothetical protein
MTPEALTALRASIKHWQDNVAAETPDDASIAAGDCALCDAFHDEGQCTGCPVFNLTGKPQCRKTPYANASFWFEAWEDNPSIKNITEWRKAAQAELDFLISLLPEGELRSYVANAPSYMSRFSQESGNDG